MTVARAERVRPSHPARSRRRALLSAVALALAARWIAVPGAAEASPDFLDGFRDPPREFSVMPFWFWNDDLQDAEMVRQIADFEAHGVYGFVIHPRIGLPAEIGWMSDRLLHHMRVAIEEAARRSMLVVLYDEGMYPSGSSSGQVVARNPAHAARGLARLECRRGETPRLEPGWKLVTERARADGSRVAVVDRPSGGVIRGLHYLGGETGRLREETPPAADILNPEAVDSFLGLVYDRYAREFGAHFGRTILAVFTDEPSMLGRGPARGLVPGSEALLPQLARILGRDIREHLPDLWDASGRGPGPLRAEYERAVGLCLEENYYRRLSEWCVRHGTALAGHPAGSMDLGAERHFQMPGQDLVWRYVVPGPSALQGEHSTMAKCASSAMIHLGRRRNSNELYGAYGHELTFEEMRWLAHWCLVRGHNLLYPHAFYYSVRGPRRDERPPDVGPHAVWWPRYKPYADACRRLCWLNTDSRHVCDVALLAEPNRLPDAPARVCFQHQRDFNYLEFRHLWEDAAIDAEGVHLAGMTYRAVILDHALSVPGKARPALRRLAAEGRLIAWDAAPRGSDVPGDATRRATTDLELVCELGRLTPPDLRFQPASAQIRCRHVVKAGRHVYLLFNEEALPVSGTISLSVAGARRWLDPATGGETEVQPDAPVTFAPHEMRVLSVQPAP